MDPRVFDRLRAIVERESGIQLTEEKVSLVQNRIGKRLRSLGVDSEGAYLKIIESDAEGRELLNLIDCISTNVTHFYREQAHFHFLAGLLDGWKREGRQSGRLWCAASSSGEEPYTIAMCVEEAFPGRPDFRILATDISTRVLAHAVCGIYDAKHLRELPPEWRDRYFSPAAERGCLEVAPALKARVLFRRLNLSAFPYPLRGPVDVIMCRNVMIYFSVDLRRRLVAEFTRLLPSGGHLVVGHSENLLGIDHDLVSLHSGIYRKR